MSIPLLNRFLSRLPQQTSLQTVLIVPFILQIFGVVGVVGWLSLRNGQQAVNEVASQLQNEISARIEQNVIGYIATPQLINQINQSAIKVKFLNMQNIKPWEKHLWEQVQLDHNLAFVGTAFKNGEYRSAENMANGEIRINASGPSTHFDFLSYKVNNRGETTTLASVSKIPDVRTYSPYKEAVKAGKATWSSVYASYLDATLMVSALQPMYTSKNELEGVLVSTLRLDFLSNFLANLKIGKTGQAFIIDRNGKMLATSTSEVPIRTINNQRTLFKAIDSQNQTTQKTALYLANYFHEFNQIKKSQQLNFAIDGKRQFLQVLPFKDSKGLDWLIVVVVPEADFMEQIDQNTHTTILLCLIALVVATGIGVLTTSWIARPILQLNQASQAIARGEFDRVVAVEGISELKTLAQSFTSMAGQLKASFVRLEAQNEELKRLDQLKDEFLANTSHELRTPLNGIIGIAESLSDGATGELPLSTLANLSLIASSGRRLSRLISDILDFSKLRHKTLELKLKPVDLRTVTQVVLTLSQPLIVNKNLQLVNSIPVTFPPIEADEDRLQQILHNLVGNAIKFTHSGSIILSAEVINSQLSNGKENGYIAMTISDTGIGIPEDKFESIFESFEQAEGSTAREYGGTGLGLAVTKKLVELHGGEISVKSQVGAGSQFTFTLPISHGQVTSTLPLTATPDRITLELALPQNLQNYQPTELNEKQFKVLIVDDEPINRQVLINNLSLYNYAITEASNGQEALAIMEKSVIPDLILLDVMMPKMTGYEVCQQIRERFPAHELPIVMLTAKDRITDIVEGFASGANDYLCKPIQKQEMLARIKTHLDIAKLTLAYGRFVPRNFLRFLEKDSIIDVQIGDQMQQEMTVMFSDIRSFTDLSEGMSPQENFNFLNSYLSRVSPQIREHKGFIDKYIGDAIMALFPESASDAILAALAMQQEVILYNQHRQKVGYPPIEIGIGLHTGNLMLGTVGESERMDTTVISDAVNLASRLEGLTKLYGAGILVSEQTIAQLENLPNIKYRFLDRVRVKGKSESVTVYEIYDEDVGSCNLLKSETQKQFKQAFSAYSQQDFVGAKQQFQEILAINPQDKAVLLYIKRCEEYQYYGVAQEWQGVTSLDFK